MTERALVLLPTYNEKDNIEKISRQVIAIDPRIEVLIVDDNSPDGTGQIADRLAGENPRIKVLHRTDKQGLGRAFPLRGLSGHLGLGVQVVGIVAP